MKTVWLKNNAVREIIPEYALPVEKWYGAEFAAQCLEAPDDVEQGWIYSAGEFSPPAPAPDPPLDDITALQLALAELAEAQAALDIENKLAIAELAEALLGGGA